MLQPYAWSPQSLNIWQPVPITVNQALQCEIISLKVMMYREKNNFLTSHCWMDEWATGYFCALRDIHAIDNNQWGLLCSAFQSEGL